MHVLLEDDLGRLTLRRVSPWHRLLARVLGASLDRQLAAGARPEGSALLAARALFLTSPSYRRALAASLRRLLALSASPQAPRRPAAGARSAGPFRPYLPVRQDRIARSAPQLTGLADCLTARGPAPARGVALVGQLLADGGGPLYRANSQGDLDELIEQASLALAG